MPPNGGSSRSVCFEAVGCGSHRIFQKKTAEKKSTRFLLLSSWREWDSPYTLAVE